MSDNIYGIKIGDLYHAPMGCVFFELYRKNNITQWVSHLIPFVVIGKTIVGKRIKLKVVYKDKVGFLYTGYGNNTYHIIKYNYHSNVNAS